MGFLSKSKMMKFSVIMPTMWRSHRTISLINTLCASDYVDELIIIDNDVTARPEFDIDSKVVMLEQKENIYVNPAWNLGVKESKNDYLCIINDDITLNFGYGMVLVESFLKHEKAVIGIHPQSYSYPHDGGVGILVGHFVGNGWGCCMFMHKDNWVDIPNDIKIWYGDNWIVNHHDKHYSLIKKVETEMQTTSGSIEMNPVIQNDINLFNGSYE